MPRHHRLTLCALSALTALAVLAGCSTTPTAPLPTVATVDLARYAGGWYEISALPNRFQAMCVADTKAHYRAIGDDIEVINRCRQADGSVTRATGIAKVVADSGNAKLRVSFFRPFYGNYWVLALDPDYRWVLVGEPKRRFGWVLSRTPQMAPADLDAALQRAVERGYARADFKPTPQSQPLD
ncbi:Lipocalin family protein [Leptothrix cholodnii SP-6]|uniref:Outer membrane lipoprotein Blc n=1 Tax=Leptothrix cholodnii (strain ATCC 51168 / LMG 8142 / SP-6) TaxID=395495 RepID=B1Y587_LEPCP|nr:lipocalin family protein [Leptothrix cholodnii]ACB32317.1 Lipocalin family protein [Leptothrix cholodnii SP-6]